MKTIGILGGIGPQATMQLEALLHVAAQQVIPPLYNSGYPPMVVHYHRYAPIVITEDLQPVFPIQPDPRLLNAAKQLGAVADFLLIPSNGVHIMQKEIEQASGKQVLSMIGATLEEVKKRQWRRVGVLGYRNVMIYTSKLKEMNIEFEIVSQAVQDQLDIAIMKVMEGRDDTNDRGLMKDVIEELNSRNIDGIIPGCTEIPILLGHNFKDEYMVNPAKLLAEAAIRFSMS